MKCVFDTIMYPMNNRSLSIDKWESNYKHPVICRRTKLPPTWESHLMLISNFEHELVKQKRGYLSLSPIPSKLQK